MRLQTGKESLKTMTWGTPKLQKAESSEGKPSTERQDCWCCYFNSHRFSTPSYCLGHPVHADQAPRTTSDAGGTTALVDWLLFGQWSWSQSLRSAIRESFASPIAPTSLGKPALGINHLLFPPRKLHQTTQCWHSLPKRRDGGSNKWENTYWSGCLQSLWQVIWRQHAEG